MRKLLLVPLLAVACSGRSAERDGDTAWHQGRWAVAMAAYQSAGSTPDLLAKYADAALHGGFYPEAIAAWMRLAAEDQTRATEAATGLARVAVAAEEGRNLVDLSRALAALRTVDQHWPTVQLVRGVQDDRGLTPAQAVDVWLVALAAESDPEVTGRPLLGLAGAQVAMGDCQSAVGVFRSAAMRLNGASKDSALSGMARCELGLGLAALTATHDDEAEGWFDRVLAHDPTGPLGRRALVGLGDARMRQGDVAGAVIAWRAVVTAVATPDSTFTLAMDRLQAATSAIPDSSASVSGRL